MMAKEKEMDKLAQDAIAAQKAGMSYGQYMATKEPAVIKPKPLPGVVRMVVCRYCGKEFPVYHHKNKVYCDTFCRDLYYKQQLRERREAEKNGRT